MDTQKVFEVCRRGGDPGKTIPKRDAANAELIARLPSGADYEWKRRGTDVWKTARSKPDLRRDISKLRLRTGDAIWARRKGGSSVFALRAVEVRVADPVAPCPDPNATASVKQLWVDVNVSAAELGDDCELVYMGIYNPRKIDGTNTWSQHAYRNALDFRMRRKSQPDSSIDTAATTKVVNDVRATGHASQVLWGTSGHTYHCHLSGSPLRSGTP